MRPDVLTMVGREGGRRSPFGSRNNTMLAKKATVTSAIRIQTPRSCCQRSLKRLQILIWCKAPRCKCSLTFASPRGAAAGVSRRPVQHTAARTQGSLTPSPRVLVVLA